MELTMFYHPDIMIARQGNVCYTPSKGNHGAKGGFYPTCFFGGYYSPPDERKEGDIMYVTYQDFFLFCTFIVALSSLFYQIFKDKRK